MTLFDFRVALLTIMVGAVGGCDSESESSGAGGDAAAAAETVSAATSENEADSMATPTGSHAASSRACVSAEQCLPIRRDTDGCPDLQGTETGHIHAARGDAVSLQFSDSIPEDAYLIIKSTSSSPFENGPFTIHLAGESPRLELPIASNANVGEYQMMIVNLANAVCPPLDFVVFVEPAP